ALETVVLQVLGRGSARLYGAGGGDVVGRDRIAQGCRNARTGDVRDRLGLARHTVEVRRLADVGRLLIPLQDLAPPTRQAAAASVAGEHIGVGVSEHLRVDRRLDRVVYLLRRRPDVPQVDVVASLLRAQRIGLEIEVHRAGDRIR